MTFKMRNRAVWATVVVGVVSGLITACGGGGSSNTDTEGSP